MSDNVEIRISGTVDSSLTASTTAASAQLETLGATATATGAQASVGAAQVASSFEEIAATSTSTARTTGVNFQDIINQTTGVSRATQNAEKSLLGMSMAAAEASSMQKTASTLVQVAGAADVATKAVHNNRAATETLVIAHEALSGRMSRIPGSMMILAQAATGAGTATLFMAAGAVAVVGGLGYLVYEALEAKKALDKMAEGFALTGRAAEMSKDEISYNLDFLSKLPGATREATQGYMEFVAQHANVSAVLANEVGQLLPAMIDLYGKQAPEAAGKLTETLTHLTVEGFQKLDREMLNLNPTQYQTIENLIETGHTAEAVSAIMKQLSANSGIYIKSLGDQVYDIEQKIAALKKTMTGPELRGIGDTVDVQRLKAFQKQLEDIRALEAKQGQQEANNKYKDELDAARKVTTELDKRGTIQKRINQLTDDAAEAQKRGDTKGESTFLAAKTAEQDKLAKLDKQTGDESYRNFLAGENAKLALYKEGSAQRAAILRQELSEATRIYGAGSTQALEIQAKINAGQRSSSQQATSEREKEERTFQQILNKEARDSEAVNKSNTQTQIELSKIALNTKRQDLDADLAAHRITAAQKLAILEELARQEAALDIEGLRNQMAAEDRGSVAYVETANKIRVIEAQLQQTLAQLRREAATEEEQENQKRLQGYRSLVQQITSAERGLVSGIFSGRQTLTQSLLQLGSQLVEKEVENDIEYYTTKLLYARLGLVAEETMAKGGLLVHVLTEHQKTAATVTGAATREAAETASSSSWLGTIGNLIASWLGFETAKTAAATAGQAAQGAVAVAEVGSAAAVSGANAFAATAAIPIIGPELAPAAAAAAYAETMTFAPLASLAVGTNFVPADMLAQIHAGERIIPAADNADLMDAVNGGGGGGVHLHYGPTLHSREPTTMKDLMRSQGNDFIREVGRLARNGAFNGKGK